MKLHYYLKGMVKALETAVVEIMGAPITWKEFHIMCFFAQWAYYGIRNPVKE